MGSSPSSQSHDEARQRRNTEPAVSFVDTRSFDKRRATVTSVNTEQTPSEQSQSNQGSALSLSSGYSSVSEKEQVHSTMASVPGKKMVGMTQRPSQLIKSISAQQDEEELQLEAQLLKKTTALNTAFKGFDECTVFVKDETKRKEDFYGQLDKLLCDKVVKMFTEFSTDEKRTVMGNRLARIGFVQPLVGFYIFALEDMGILAVTSAFVEEAKTDKDPGFLLALTIREILWNFSDSSPRFSEAIADTEIFKYLVNDLDNIWDDGLDQLEDEEDTFAFSSAVGILHNCARNTEIDREEFRKHKAVEILLQFVQSRGVYLKMITLLALGNMVTEEEADHLTTNADVFDFVLQAMSKAMGSKDRKEHGFHLSELVDGLASLAKSDSNKKLIMAKEKAIPMIVEILDGKDVAEALAAIKLVWELAFLDDNKKIFLKNKKLLSKLDKLRNDKTDHDLQQAAQSAWFVIVGSDDRLKNTVKIKPEDVPGVIATNNEPAKPSGKHIMISYNWGDKEMVLKIYQLLLRRNLKIWIDVAEMNKYTNLLDGMAQAVENSYVILICFSEKYKNSQNCRTEANYGFTLQKEIIPLKMQRGYNPDGWLGALIGARLFIEFSDKYPFEMKFDELISTLPKYSVVKESVRKAVMAMNVIPLSQKKEPEAARPPSTKPSSTRDVTVDRKVWDWNKTDIETWAKKYKLEHKVYAKVKLLTGEQLHFFYRVMNKAPDTFYRWAEQKLMLTGIEELMRFDAAIQGLMMHL